MHDDSDPKTVYAELCKAHDGIADFRARLLALLPIASGGGMFLLLNDKLNLDGNPILFPIGVFGVLISLGLFIYELRGIQKCNALIEVGKTIEQTLGKGRFTCEGKGVLKGLIGVTWAGLLIYPALIGGWSFVACLGTAFSPNALEVSGLFAAVAMVGGFLVTLRQGQELKKAKTQHQAAASKPHT